MAKSTCLIPLKLYSGNKWLSILLRSSQVEVIRPYRCLIVQVINYRMLISSSYRSIVFLYRKSVLMSTSIDLFVLKKREASLQPPTNKKFLKWNKSCNILLENFYCTWVAIPYQIKKSIMVSKLPLVILLWKKAIKRPWLKQIYIIVVLCASWFAIHSSEKNFVMKLNFIYLISSIRKV